MEAMILFVLSLLLALPVATLILAILAYRRNTESAKRLDMLTRTVHEIREGQAGLLGRVSDLEQAGRTPAVAAAEPLLPEVEKPGELELEEIEELPIPTPPAPPRAAPDVPSPPPARPPSVQPPRVPPRTPATPTGQGLERQFGTRVAVWLGAVALALAGGFLVKYSVERGLIGPTARIVLGLLFGVSLLGVGEWIAKTSGCRGRFVRFSRCFQTNGHTSATA